MSLYKNNIEDTKACHIREFGREFPDRCMYLIAKDVSYVLGA